MRSNAAEYDLIAPGTLNGVLSAMAEHPGTWTPIAGGTELMVALGAGRLLQKSFVSLGGLKELRFLDDSSPETLRIGAGTTFTDLRRSEVIAREFPLIAQTASWTGSLANQNRGTLGGNIANASPAADTPPALLAYDAAIELISVRGVRTLPYGEFHLGYKKTALAADELVFAMRLPRRFMGYKQWVRKVGTRNAQAISKIAIAGVTRLEGGLLHDVRLGAASLRDRPVRLSAVEAALEGQVITNETIRAARAALVSEVVPIDDIRSAAKYRIAVAQNLVEEFLRSM
jgi:CO/xanthine dehydrogenase FAD-binding subunit